MYSLPRITKKKEKEKLYVKVTFKVISMGIVSFLRSLPVFKICLYFQGFSYGWKIPANIFWKIVEPLSTGLDTSYAHIQRKDIWFLRTKGFLCNVISPSFLGDDCLQSGKRYIMGKLPQFSLVLTCPHLNACFFYECRKRA